ncbi:RagB/SusD family nutrient uptake outer membrane protein [Lutibacter sp. A64]|uniref:RagB/SusD family nutrient uptake outer membrane protein n=1 Tax=Lutibacter sp. A64 TaxID=2918526 RepID=UPI001F0600A0|nr:RagB/SusD family nutrient uptake outer membrane protein [Lutibacter sp. A64]UMB53606.1 RagB/SusD family nutrient uptake outer membrane protein [Lutibacter sp. A64]
MKKQINNVAMLIAIIFIVSSCVELDLDQQDAASSENWYQTSEQFRQSLNEGYRSTFFPSDGNDGAYNPGWDDDVNYRTNLGPIKSGTVDSNYSRAKNDWTNMYKAITRILTVLEKIKTQSGVLSSAEEQQFEGEANFFLGVYWTYLITHYGDVPFYDTPITIDESFTIARTDKAFILQKIYEYFDVASQNLPVSYLSGLEYATKGAALAFKARAAIYMGDNATAAIAAKACMDLNAYELHPNFEELFLSSTKESKEIIFKLPRSEEFLQTINSNFILYMLPRNEGGYGSVIPSWELLASFECVDGLPIDESPLFDSHNPFKNRDPRLLATIVPFGSLKDGDGLSPDSGSRHMAREYNPHPEHTRVFNYLTSSLETNKDTKSNQNFCSFNGLLFKKGIDSDWADKIAANDLILMRYADVLLMYAEAKIELNEIDASVLNAINEVRDRAYANSSFSNPTVTTTDQVKLRYIVRNERRSELAGEWLRYMDLIRWRLADVIMDGGHTYGLAPIAANADPNVIQENSDLMVNVVNPGNWFWGLTPQIDENGVADFMPLVDAGLAQILTTTSFPSHQYLWPIPDDERRLNPNLTQNEGY